MKRCTRCQVEKSLEFFYKSARGKSGRNSECKECTKRQSRLWKKNNPAKVNAQNARWREHHPDLDKASKDKWANSNHEKIIIGGREYRKNNRIKTNSASRKWKKGHPEQRRAMTRRRRARKADNGHEPYTEAQVLERWGTDCHLCHEPIGMVRASTGGRSRLGTRASHGARCGSDPRRARRFRERKTSTRTV